MYQEREDILFIKVKFCPYLDIEFELKLSLYIDGTSVLATVVPIYILLNPSHAFSVTLLFWPLFLSLRF